MSSNIELYEVLKPKLGEEGARLIAERLPDTAELATKDDLRLLRTDFDLLRTDFAEFKAEMRGWMLKFFVPLWIGVYGTLGAVIVSVVVKS